MPSRFLELDGAALFFDPASGVNRLIRNNTTRNLRRRAPRSLQVGLVSTCNLTCGFCYRDAKADNKLSREFLVDFLGRAADWGVLEVAFGGGEPLLFPEFPEMLQELRVKTPLALNFTSNGTLLDSKMLERLGDSPNEIRISAYPDNSYRETIRMLKGRNVGVNWLVTPANFGLIETYARDFIELGARNILLLGYMGADESMCLSPSNLAQLRSSILRMRGAPLRLHICWYPLLSDLPHLFDRGDCGAGDEFLTITPDRCVQACSFSSKKWPFDDIEDVVRIYQELRDAKPAAEIGGCTRRQFQPTPTPDGDWAWHSYSSNNSGDWSIIGRFKTAKEAEQAAEALRRLSRAHEAFLSSVEGQRWIESVKYNGSIPTPPVKAFGQAHGFDWSQDGQGLWWECDGAGAPVLTAGVVGTDVLVYHEYCMGLPEQPFREFFARTGAEYFGYWKYDQPAVRISARGANQTAADAIHAYFSELSKVEYASDAGPPPWGVECTDPRVLEDENRSAGLRETENEVHVSPEGLELVLHFENGFAGTLAVCAWLKLQGFSELRAEMVGELEALPTVAKLAKPAHDLFPPPNPRANKIAAMSIAELIDEALTRTQMDDALRAALKRLDPQRLDFLAHSQWMGRTDDNPHDLGPAANVIAVLGKHGATWARQVWDAAKRAYDKGATDHIHAGLVAIASALESAESFGLASAWVKEAQSRVEYRIRLGCLESLGSESTLGLVEEFLANAPANEMISDWLTRIASASRLDWARARRWIEAGRPLSLVSLSTLCRYAETKTPPNWEPPSRGEFDYTLAAYVLKDPVPRVEAAVGALRGHRDKLCKSQ